MRAQSIPKRQQKASEREYPSYEVGGKICFVCLAKPTETETHRFEKAIRQVDRQFPWRDDRPIVSSNNICLSHPSYTPPARSSSEEEEHGYCFKTSLVGNLRRGQVYAYEKYLAKLAEELATLELGEKLIAVYCFLRITTAHTFEIEG